MNEDDRDEKIIAALEDAFENEKKGLRWIDLKDKSGLTESRYSSGLRALKKHRIIEKLEAEGLYILTKYRHRYPWLNDYQKFVSVDQYERKKILNQELIKKLKEERFIDDIKQVPIVYTRSFDYLLRHLKSGYRDVYNKYEEWKKVEAEKCEAYAAFTREIETIFSVKGFKIKNGKTETKYKEVSEIVFYIIKNYFYKNKIKNIKESIELKESSDGSLCDPEFNVCVATYKEPKKEIEQIIGYCIHNEFIRSLFDNLADIEDKWDKSYSILDKELNHIIREVEEGIPLKGGCKRCDYLTKIK